MSWIELQILFRCCLMLISIIILRHIFYLVYLCACLGLSQFISYLCLFASACRIFVFNLNFIVINHTTSLKQTNLFFVHFLECLLLFLDDDVWRKLIVFKSRKFSRRMLLSFCLVFCQYQPGIAYKSVAYEKIVYIRSD